MSSSSTSAQTTDSSFAFIAPADASLPPRDRQYSLVAFKDHRPVLTVRFLTDCTSFGSDPVANQVRLAHESCSRKHAVVQFRKVPATSLAASGGRGERVPVDEHGLLPLNSASASAKSATAVLGDVCKPFVIDCHSTHGTFLNGQKLQAGLFYELREGDVLRFAHSSREYVLVVEQR